MKNEKSNLDRRNGFVYLDLSDPRFTPKYRLSHGRGHEDAYVAELAEREFKDLPLSEREIKEMEREVGLIDEDEDYGKKVVQVYRLITRKTHSSIYRRFAIRKSDGKTLATVVKDSYWVDKFKRFYEFNRSPRQVVNVLLRDSVNSRLHREVV